MNQAHRNPALSEHREAKKFIMECPHHGIMKICFFAQSFLNSHFSSEYPTDGNSSLESARLALPTLMKGACVLPWLRVFGSLRQSNCWLPHPIPLLRLQSSTLHFSTLIQKPAIRSGGLVSLPDQHTNFPANSLLNIRAKQRRGSSWDDFRVLQTGLSQQCNDYCTHGKALTNYWKTLTSLLKFGI